MMNTSVRCGPKKRVRPRKNRFNPFTLIPTRRLRAQQITRLSTTFQLINLTRADTIATDEVKQAQLANLSNVSLKPDSIKLVLSISDSRWDAVQQESLRLLEQIMRSPVRTDNLDAVQASVPSLVSLTLDEDESNLVSEFVSAFVITNSQYSADLTAAAQKSARDAVQPIVQTYKAGERIVSSGDIITPADMEALQEFKLIQVPEPIETYLGAAALTILSAAFIGLYFLRRRKVVFLSDPRSLLMTSVIFIAFILGARFVIPNRTIIPYLYPLPAAGLLLTTLVWHGKRDHSFVGHFRAGRLWIAKHFGVDAVLYLGFVVRCFDTWTGAALLGILSSGTGDCWRRHRGHPCLSFAHRFDGLAWNRDIERHGIGERNRISQHRVPTAISAGTIFKFANADATAGNLAS